MKKTGIIGWRGMVGSVLLDRMREENDFAHIEPIFFTTSQAGQAGPDVGVEIPLLQSAFDIEALKQMDIILTCQGGDYTKEVLLQAGAFLAGTFFFSKVSPFSYKVHFVGVFMIKPHFL